MRGSSMSLHANLMRGSSMSLHTCIKIPSWRFIPINMIVAFDAEVPGPSFCRWRRDGLSELHHLSLNNRRWTMNPEHTTAYGNRTQIPKLIMFWFHQVQAWSSRTKGLYRPLHRLWWRFNSGNECWVLWISPKVWLVLQWWMNLESMYCSDDWILKVWVMHKYK